MSRQPLSTAYGRTALRLSRMSPGGRLWSESPIRRRSSRWSSAVAQARQATYVDYMWECVCCDDVETSDYDFHLFSRADTSLLHEGDKVIGVVVMDGGSSTPTYDPPSGWTILGTDTYDTSCWVIVAIDSWDGSESDYLHVHNLTPTAGLGEGTWTDIAYIGYILRDIDDLTFTPARTTFWGETMTGAWEAPSSNWTGAFSFIITTGFDSGLRSLVPHPDTHTAWSVLCVGSDAIHSPPLENTEDGLQIFQPRPSGAFTFVMESGDEVKPTGPRLWTTAVGLA